MGSATRCESMSVDSSHLHPAMDASSQAALIFNDHNIESQSGN